MAQGAITTAPSVAVARLTRDELHEIQEYEKIIRFRDVVYSGAHPRIQIPPHLAGKSLVKPLSPNTVVTPSNQPPTPYSSTAPAAKTYTGRENGSDGEKLLDGRRLMAGRPPVGLGKTNISAINPILLEKSADLIKAEIQLHRQRLERSLRDQVDQRRISMKAASQTSESLPDFDLSDVLSKAFTIVHPSTASEAGQSQGGRTSASDSFDDNTFYSSQHNTPEHATSPRGRRESGEGYPSAVAPLNAPDSGPSVVRYQDESPSFISRGAPPSNVVPGLQELARSQISAPLGTPSAVGVNQSNELLKAATSNKPATDIARPVAEKQAFALTPHSNVSTPQEAAPSRIEAHERNRIAQGGPDAVPSQVASATPQKRRLTLEEPETVRNFNLSPVAPQPARVSPLATARAPVISQEAFTLQENPTPILSPMHEVGASPTTGGAPKTSKRAERRKGKGKSDDLRSATGNNPASAIATPASPYIKPEPKSPSPFQSAPLPRPHKRQRQTLQQGAGLDYDEPQEDTIVVQPVAPRARDVRARPVQRGGERLGEAMEIDQPQRQRMVRDEAPSRRIVSQEIYRDPQSPAMYAVPYPQYEQRPVRASSRMVADTYYQEPPAYYREPPAAPGAVIELDPSDRSLSPILMAPPPRMAPSRIVVDEYGRQYYTAGPNPPRQSVAPQPRIIDDSYYYDRPPPRAIRRPVQHAYEDDGVIYRRASPQYVPQRRVITLPETLAEPQYRQREYSTRPVATRPPAEDYAAPGEREPIEIRQREYSTRPPPARQPVDDYVRVAEAPRRQPTHFEEPPHEYLPQRVASVRPEAAFRHEMRGEYLPRAQSIRPEPIHREYAASVRPEGRREVPSQIIREYSVRPGEAEVVRREYMPTRTMDEYPPQPQPMGRPMARRVVEEQEYIPWRPGQQEVYGGEDTQREVIYK
jgi:hypothetical protein